MERKDIRFRTRRDYVDMMELEDEFCEIVIQHWMDGKVPHDMVNINEDSEYARVYYGYA
jgi:hypothetical protein